MATNFCLQTDQLPGLLEGPQGVVLEGPCDLTSHNLTYPPIVYGCHCSDSHQYDCDYSKPVNRRGSII